MILADVVYLGLVSRLQGADRDRVWQAASIGSLSSALVLYLVLAWLDLFGPTMMTEIHVLMIGGISGAIGGVSGALALALGFSSFDLSSWRRLIGAASIYVAEGAAVVVLCVLVVILSANIDHFVQIIKHAIDPDGETAWSLLVAAVAATNRISDRSQGVLVIRCTPWAPCAAVPRRSGHPSNGGGYAVRASGS